MSHDRLRQILLTNIAGRQRKKSAWEDFPFVRDEDESLAVIQTARCTADRVDGPLICTDSAYSRLALSDSLLQKKTSVMLRFGRLDIETCDLGKA